MHILRFYKTLVLIFLKLNLFYPRFLFLVVYLRNWCTNEENDIINFQNGNSSFVKYMLTTTVILWNFGNMGTSRGFNSRHPNILWNFKKLILKKEFPRSVNVNDIYWFTKLIPTQMWKVFKQSEKANHLLKYF